jgi:hypothetical protein
LDELIGSRRLGCTYVHIYKYFKFDIFFLFKKATIEFPGGIQSHGQLFTFKIGRKSASTVFSNKIHIYTMSKFSKKDLLPVSSFPKTLNTSLSSFSCGRFYETVSAEIYGKNLNGKIRVCKYRFSWPYCAIKTKHFGH